MSVSEAVFALARKGARGGLKIYQLQIFTLGKKMLWNVMMPHQKLAVLKD